MTCRCSAYAWARSCWPRLWEAMCRATRSVKSAGTTSRLQRPGVKTRCCQHSPRRRRSFNGTRMASRCRPVRTLLATSPASPVQAFRYGEHAYGFQFHLEANRPLINRWLSVPAHQQTLEEEAGSIDPDAIRRQAETSAVLLEQLSLRDVFSLDRQVRDRSSQTAPAITLGLSSRATPAAVPA